MDNAKELLHAAVNVIIFCLAVCVLIQNVRLYHRALHTIKESYQDEILLEGSGREVDITIVTKGELIATLLQPCLEYDIEIDHQLILRSAHKKTRIEDYNIRYDTYKKTYSYDDNGAITKISYQSKR